jgi:hypothetical protein
MANEGLGGNSNGKKRLTKKRFRITIHQVHPRRVEMPATMRTPYLKSLRWITVLIFPAALFAADQPAAMLYTHGSALLNGSGITRSSAIFSGDVVETNASSAANINASGSIVLVLNDSLVQYQDHTLKLEHGGVSISTSKLLSTRAGDVIVSPASTAWTEFEVRDVDGQVQIAARKGDLTISDDKGTSTLAQGQETTRQESESQEKGKKKKKREAAAAPAAAGGALSSPVAIGIGGAAALGVTAWVLIKSDDPASPSK